MESKDYNLSAMNSIAPLENTTQFKRTKKDILNDYKAALISKNIFTPEEIPDLTDTFLEEMLIKKLYETEIIRRQTVSTLDAFYHWCRFVVYKDLDTNREVWNPFVKQMFINFERNKLVSIMAGRSMGKSYFIFGLYITFKHFLWERFQTIIMCNIPRMGKRNLKVMKDVIDNNELLFSKIKESTTEDWATQGIIRFNDGSIEVISLGSTPKSAHVNLALVDDPLRDDNKYSNEQIENMILGSLMPTIGRKHGRMAVLGTPSNNIDIFHKIMLNKQGKLICDGSISTKNFASFVYPMYKNLDTKEMTFPGTHIPSEIELIRQAMGEDKFMREYQLECITDSTRLFTYEMIEKASDPKEPTLTLGKEGILYIVGVDVAVSGEASADFSAFTVLEIQEGESKIGGEVISIVTKKIIRHVFHVKGMPIHEQINYAEQLSKNFNNATVAVEVNNVGVALIQELEQRGVPVITFRTDKYVKESMVRFLVNEIKLIRIIFPEEDEEIAALKKELINFGVRRSEKGVERMEAISGHDDLVLSLAIANVNSKDIISGCTFAITQD